MPAMTTAEVAYAQVDAVLGMARTRRRVQLTFPTSASNNTYSTGGVPLLAPNLGCPRGVVNSLKVVAITPSATASMNPMWIWNGSTSAPKLIGIREAAAVADGVPFDELANATAITQNSQIVTVEVEGS